MSVRKRPQHPVHLRPPQQAAYAALQADDRGIIKMFCGTGKTRVIYRLLVDSAVPIFLIVFPRIALIEQFKRDYLNNEAWAPLVVNLDTICICSQTEKEHSGFTTDADDIEEFLTSDHPQKLICVTYQSLDTLTEALELCEVEVDIAIFDEAHHCVAPVTYDLLTYGPLAEASRAYFFTATPRPEMEADEDEIFGPILFTYTHREAAEDDICNDFEIICRFALPDEYNIYEHMAAAYARTPNGRMIVFHSFAEAEVEGRTSVVQFSGAAARHQCTAAFTRLGLVPKLSAVIAKTANKQGILDDFEVTADDAVSLLHNCSILGEGIDTKAANAVVFADPKASTTAIIQNIGRATRKPAGVTRPASIIIPVVVDINKFNVAATAEERHKVLCDEFTKGGFQAIQNVLAALRQEDEELMDAILRSPTRYTKAEVERTFRAAGYEKVAEAATLGELCGVDAGATEEEVASVISQPIEIHSGDMEEPIRKVGSGDNTLKVMHSDDTWTKMERPDAADAKVKAPRRPMKVRYDISEKLGIQWDTVSAVEDIGAATLKCTLGSDNWEERRQEWIAMYEKLGRYPHANKADIEEQKVAFWQFNQRSFYKRGASHMTTERISILNSTPGWIWEAENTWEPNRQYWIATHLRLGRCPSNKSKDPEEKKAGSWQGTQRQGYKNKEIWLAQERIDILNATEGWKWEVEDTWELNRQHWIAIYNKLDRCPSNKSKDIEEKKAGIWQTHMRQNYKNGKLLQKCIDILNATEGWAWESEDPWEPQRQHWILMCSSLEKLPAQSSSNPDEKRAGQWQQNQRQRFKKGNIPQNLVDILNSTEGWKWNEDDSWEIQRQHWISMYSKLGRCPTDNSKDAEEKKAGQWQSNQRKYYKDKKLWMTKDRIDILNATEGWAWEKDDTWEPNRQHWIVTYLRLGKCPSNKSKDPEEKKSGTWQTSMRMAYKNKETRVTQERIDILNATEGWKWSEKDDASSVSSAENTIVQPRPRKFKLPTPEAEPSGREQAISEIGTYHKRFHNLYSATYYDEIRAKPETFAAYHEVADSLDAKDAPEQQVMTRLAAEAAKLPPKCRIADLGCGMNRLRTLAPHCNWTSVDAVAADDSVQVADLATLPFDDCHFQAAVLSRALWGRDHAKQLAEAFRILNYGAPLYVCESRRRWLSDDGTNQLLEDLKSAGFQIKVGPEAGDEVFQYIIAQKPALL